MVHSKAGDELSKQHAISRKEEETGVKAGHACIKHKAGHNHHHHHHHHHHHLKKGPETAHESAMAAAKKLHKSANEGRLGETLIEVEDADNDLSTLQAILQPFAMTMDTTNGEGQVEKEALGEALEEEEDKPRGDLGNNGVGYGDGVSAGKEEKTPQEFDVSAEEEDAVEDLEEERRDAVDDGQGNGGGDSGKAEELSSGYEEDDEDLGDGFLADDVPGDMLVDQTGMEKSDCLQ